MICFVKGKCKKMVPECLFFGTNVKLFLPFFLRLPQYTVAPLIFPVQEVSTSSSRQSLRHWCFTTCCFSHVLSTWPCCLLGRSAYLLDRGNERCYSEYTAPVFLAKFPWSQVLNLSLQYRVQSFQVDYNKMCLTVQTIFLFVKVSIPNYKTGRLLFISIKIFMVMDW